MRRIFNVRWLFIIGTLLLLALGLRDARGRSKTSTLPLTDPPSPKPTPAPSITERIDTPSNPIVSAAEQ